MFLPLHDRNPIRHVAFPFVSYSLIAINVLVFLVQLTQTGSPTAFDEFAIRYATAPYLLAHPGEFDQLPGLPDQLTLITYAFLHADWLHLGSNMLFLWVFGDNVEDALGHVKFLIFYLACAVLSGLAFVAMSGGTGWVIGASGAVAGVMGAYLVLYPHARVYVLFRLVIPVPLPIPALWMVGVWIATQVFYAVTAGESDIAWWAHLGGIVAGALLCVPLKRRQVALFGGR
ncbi:rhomboid family intramembrane serine protease [Devosia sp.]|uniref:rhomboid family intramembrane serine protease n=1 Tax=Devosia sp. TaxID=1871048 RepID=UPI003A93FFE6